MDWLDFNFSGMLDKIHDFMDKIPGMLKDAYDWVIEQIIYLLGKLFFIIYSALLSVVEALVAGISFVGNTAISFAEWANLPDEIIWMMNQIGLPDCLSMISAAILIRVSLNLIPGVMTRI